MGPFLDLAEAVGGQLAKGAGDAARPYDVAAALLAEFGSGGAAVVVVEDVHWADEASLDVIRLLARRIEAVPALFILSYRDDELDRSHPLRWLGDLAGGGQVTRVAAALPVVGGGHAGPPAGFGCPGAIRPDRRQLVLCD